jgi:tetratricopeptide (TPR) repeat protein
MIGLFLTFASVAMAAEDRLVYPLPSDAAVTVQRDVVYDAGRNLKIDIYRPAGVDAAIPPVLFINVGGNYRNWAQYTGWGRLVTSIGMGGVVYDAHQGGGAEDSRAVLQYLREHAAQLHLDASRIIVWACSSNVTIGLPVVMDAALPEIRAAVIYYGTAEVRDIRLDLPLMMVRAGLDGTGLNKGIDAFVARATALNAPLTFLNLGAAHHAFDIRDDNETSRSAIAATLEFMKTQVRPMNLQAIAAGVEEATAASAVYRGDGTGAVRGYEALAAKRPGDSEVHRNFGNALLNAGDYRKALAEYRRALELGNPNVGWISYSAAVACVKLGDTETALGYIEKLKNIPPMWRQLNGDPDMAALKDNPRFRAVANQ